MMENKILLENANVIDVYEGESRKGYDVYIEGDMIKEVCPHGQLSFGEDTERVNCTEKTIMPGLIDCHVHLCMDPFCPDPSVIAARSDAALTIDAINHMDALLKNGITYVRGMGDPRNIDIDLARAKKADQIAGPDILPCGKLICMTGGHGWQLGVEVDSPDEMRKAVRQLLKDGAGHLKMMATGGVMTKGVKTTSTQLTYEELRAGIEEAEHAGVRTATHAQGNAGIKNAVRAGIHSVEHGFYLDEEVIGWMLEKGTFYVPTLVAVYEILKQKDSLPAYLVEKAQTAKDAHRASFQLALKSGVKIALGTDAGTPFNEFGSARDEFLYMIEAGMSPVQAVKSATCVAAQLIGVEDSHGSVEPGKAADLLILQKCIYDEPSVIKEPFTVYKGGKRYV